jgi:hypothetical protein
MALKDIGDFLIYLGAIAAALAAIGVVLRFVVVRPLMNKLKEELIPKTNTIHAEVTPDSGHSMKDQITRTEVKLDTLEQRFSDHLTNHP